MSHNEEVEPDLCHTSLQMHEKIRRKIGLNVKVFQYLGLFIKFSESELAVLEKYFQ
ncbi:MAG: hypothetical protein J5I59_01985 [Saprospiraceae bacterium]|nr:hypothetical protein [Saprospiraceae bacterium]